MLTHENLASNALTLVDYWRFTSADRLIHALPVFHTHGLFVAVNVALLSGATMIFMNRFDPDAIIAAMPGATSLMGVPTFYTRLLDHPGLTRGRCANMRLFVSGSAPLLAETHAEWRERTGFAILERYGMTETNMITSNPYEGERRAGTVGFPLPGVSVRIAAPESGAPWRRARSGSSRSRARTSFRGYWRMPEKTAQEFRPDGYFITGDLGLVDADGYIHIVGRAKDLVISGGFNVYPKEVEAEIDAIEGVLESAVIGVPHPDFGEGVTAVVVPRPGAALDRRGDPRGARRTARQIQGAEAGVRRRVPAAQRDGQGAEGGAAGDVQGNLSRLTAGFFERMRRASEETAKPLCESLANPFDAPMLSHIAVRIQVAPLRSGGCSSSLVAWNAVACRAETSTFGSARSTIYNSLRSTLESEAARVGKTRRRPRRVIDAGRRGPLGRPVSVTCKDFYFASGAGAPISWRFDRRECSESAHSAAKRRRSSRERLLPGDSEPRLAFQDCRRERRSERQPRCAGPRKARCARPILRASCTFTVIRNSERTCALLHLQTSFGPMSGGALFLRSRGQFLSAHAPGLSASKQSFSAIRSASRRSEGEAPDPAHRRESRGALLA